MAAVPWPASVPVQLDVDPWTASLGRLCAVCRNQGAAPGQVGKCKHAVRGRLAETRPPTRRDCAPGARRDSITLRVSGRLAGAR